MVVEGAEPITLLCRGPVLAFHGEPMLAQARRARRQPLQALVFDNAWGQASGLFPEGPMP
jgi:5,6-dimethylbenzimidazole synthase